MGARAYRIRTGGDTMSRSALFSFGLYVSAISASALAEVLTFSDPELVEEVDVGEMPEVSEDGLELFFVRGTSPTDPEPMEIWRTERTSRDELFVTPSRVTQINTTEYYEIAPRLSPDELTLYFTTNRFHGWTYLGDIAKADRASRGAPFSGASAVDSLNNQLTGEEIGGITEDGLHGVMARHPNLPLTANFQLYSFSRPDVGSVWSGPQDLYMENLRDPDVEVRTPWLSRDGKLLVFAKTVPARHFDLYYAVRPDVTSPFGVPIPLDSLNTTDTEASPSLTDDLQIIFFHSTRQDGDTERVYAAELIPPSSVRSGWEVYR
jgi:hypothetical protein